MSDQNVPEQKREGADTVEYERPAVEELETHDGPAVTAAGNTKAPT